MNEKLKVDEMGRLGLTDFRAARKFPLSVVLDNVRSVHNVGSVFRTADAFRLREVLLCGITAVPPSAPRIRWRGGILPPRPMHWPSCALAG